jgi:hypothetical protein
LQVEVRVVEQSAQFVDRGHCENVIYSQLARGSRDGFVVRYVESGSSRGPFESSRSRMYVAHTRSSPASFSGSELSPLSLHEARASTTPSRVLDTLVLVPALLVK